MKRVGFFIMVNFFVMALSLTSCKKYTTPNKVKKHIVKDSWSIQSFFLNGSSITADFNNQALSFVDGGGVLASGVTGNVGIWSLGLNKNPATLYLSNFQNYPLSELNRDWRVDSCSKKEMKFSNGDNSFVLKKISK